MSTKPTQGGNTDQIDEERIYFPDAGANIVAHVAPYMKALPFVRGRKVIDLCCGTGHGTRLLSEAAKSVIGLDYSETAIEYCESRELPNVDYFCVDVEKHDFEGSDVITCMQGLEHLEDPKALIQKHLDKMWIFALPNDTDLSNKHHHHKITMAVIQDWFNGKAMVDYFDDDGKFSKSEPEWFTNYFGIYRP